MLSALSIYDRWSTLTLKPERVHMSDVQRPNLPTVDQMVDADTTIVFGPLSDAARALQLGGIFKLALERGATVIFAYSGALSGEDQTLLRQLADIDPRAQGLELRVPEQMHPAFTTYLTINGHCDLAFARLPAESETLASRTDAFDGELLPVAAALTVGKGVLYLVPCHFTSGLEATVDRLVDAVVAHLEGRQSRVPAFHSDLFLPGETELASEIEATEDRLRDLEEQASDLRRHKLLLSHLSGKPFTELVVEELTLVLEGAGMTAQLVDEKFIEDFEVVDAKGNRLAVAEAKAASGGVALGHINQVNSHRTRLELSVTDIAGLLVVNCFRGDDALDRRTEAVNPHVVRHAKGMNTVVMRSYDLYQLVSRRLSGETDVPFIVDAISCETGWLRCEGGAPTVE